MSKKLVPLAKWQCFVLYHDEEHQLYDVCRDNKLPAELEDALPNSLPGFNCEDGFEYAQSGGSNSIELMGFIPFGHNYRLIIFSLAAASDVRWLMKTKLQVALKDDTVETHLKDTNNNMHEALIKARSGQSKVESVEEDFNTPFPSRESTTLNRPNNLGTSKTRSTREMSRDESPELRGQRSGETPGPRDGGTIVYGRKSGSVLRGFVKRGEGIEIELLDECPDDCLSPLNTNGFGPRADKKFIEEKSARAKLNTEIFKIVGCAAKWHGKPDMWIYAFIEIKDETLRKDLQSLRKSDGEKYKGHLICSFGTFREAVRNDTNDLKLLSYYLGKSQFAKNALEEKEPVDVKSKMLEKKMTDSGKKKTKNEKLQKETDDRLKQMETQIKELAQLIRSRL